MPESLPAIYDIEGDKIRGYMFGENAKSIPIGRSYSGRGDYITRALEMPRIVLGTLNERLYSPTGRPSILSEPLDKVRTDQSLQTLMRYISLN